MSASVQIGLVMALLTEQERRLQEDVIRGPVDIPSDCGSIDIVKKDAATGAVRWTVTGDRGDRAHVFTAASDGSGLERSG